MVNLEWYRTFKTIYKTGTLTGAAEELYISQPGVSLHLSSLENYTGYKLFERRGRRMIPTERGKALYNFIIEPVTRLEEAEKSFQRSTEKHTPTISIGMCFETFQTTLEPYIASFPFNIIIKFGEYPEMVDSLEKGILDLIITPQAINSKDIDYEPFSYETIVLVGGNNTDEKALHSLIKKDDLKEIEKWLKEQKWYGTTGDMEHLRRFWKQNLDKHPDFRPNYIVPNLNSIIRCLSSGTGLAVIPDFLCRKEIESKQLKLLWEGKNKVVNTLNFGTRRKTIYADEIESIKKIFREQMGRPLS